MLSRRLFSKLNALKPLARASSTGSTSTSVTTGAQYAAPAAPAVSQAPNYPTTWSTNQQPRPAANSGPRFEQTVMEVQPNPLSAMALIAEEPVRMVQGRKAVCDGGTFIQQLIHCWIGVNGFFAGGGALGHPKIYINLVCICFRNEV